MKKIIVFILAFIYLGVSSGIAMEIHYCMGKKAGVDFFGNDNKKCGRCGMTEKKGCCSDEHKFYKLNDSHKNASNDLTFKTPVAGTVVLYSGFYSIPFNKLVCKPSYYSYPLFSSPPTHILNCTFRI